MDIYNILDNLPPIDEYKKNLQALAYTDFNDYSPEDIKAAFTKATGFFSFPVMETSTKVFSEHMMFFRARKNINGLVEDINSVTTYSYPDIKFCKENGRANIKNRNVFYCSDSNMAAMWECKPVDGDIIYLSLWKPDAISEWRGAVCLPGQLPKINPAGIVIEDVKLLHGQMEGQFTPSQKRHILTFYDFVGQLFINETPPYWLTSAIANFILYQTNPRFDYLVYPSVESGQEHTNIVFHPAIVDNGGLSLAYVVKYKIMVDDKGVYHFSMFGNQDIGKYNYTTGMEWKTAPADFHLSFINQYF